MNKINQKKEFVLNQPVKILNGDREREREGKIARIEELVPCTIPGVAGDPDYHYHLYRVKGTLYCADDLEGAEMPQVSIALPEEWTWTPPLFQFGQTVYIDGNENDPLCVFGMIFHQPSSHYYRDGWWQYLLASPLSTSYYALDEHRWFDEEDIRSTPWPDTAEED